MKFLFISGFAIITPMLLCVYIAIYLRDKFHLSDFVIIAGLLLGLFSGIYSVYRIIIPKKKR